ncbi:MAG: hypothetical protein SGI84_14190 [Gemmatimonadota bacterium]|nr:hypothetical protein [Gemmatimonadota bacterium]
MAEVSDIRVQEFMVERTARVATLGRFPARELWLVLHGYGQLADRFLRSFLPVARADRIIVAPEALSRFYTSREPSRVGATWMTSEGRESEIADYLRYLDRVIDSLAVDATTFQVHGFSQGAATATRWVNHTGRPVRRLVLWGGGVAPEVDLAALRGRRPEMEWHLGVGSTDEFITAAAVAAETARLRESGVSFALHRFPGGHIVDQATLVELDSPGQRRDRTEVG